MFYLLKLYLFLLPFFVHHCSADVIGCEGFVKLFTSQGNLKYEAECNPQNGYFLIPIYNKGKYLVKIIAPDGYIFEPKFYEIEIGSNGGCSEELNFNLAGLKISGRILNGEDSSLVLGLFKQENGELVEKTIVDKDGNYNFVTWPGKYVISPFSGSTKCLSQGSIKIEVGTTPFIIKPDLRIEGYSLEVNVVDEKGDPFLSTNVVLQSDNQIKFENLPLSAEQPITINEGQKWFYKFNTNSSGSTLINCLPPGKYIINAGQKVLNFGEANFQEESVEMNSKTTKVTISVKSFNLNGIVFTAKQAPLQNVTIKLDGEFNTISDEKGKFVLANVSPGKHVLAVEKEHFEFNELNFDVSSKTKKLIKFFPNRIAVCGQILSADELEKISFKVYSLDENIFIDGVVTNFEGKFCKMLTPGKYTITPISKLLLSPSKVEIDLKEEPILELKFTQHKSKISGTINCFKKCGKISIKLFDEQGEIVDEFVDTKGEYYFSDVLPSKYTVKIFDEQNFLWVESEKNIIVEGDDIIGLDFIQKGYFLEIKSSKSALLKYWPDTKESPKNEEFQLKEGENKIYFKEENKYYFSIESCHEFRIEGIDEQQKYFNIPSNIPLILTAVSSSVSTFVQTDVEDNTLEMNLREKPTNEEQSLQKVYSTNKGKMFLFSLNNSKIGNKYQFMPKSNKLLFMPKLVDFEFNGECEGVVASFNSQIGKFIKGKVEPLVENAFVKAIHKTDESDVLTTNTDNKGLFSIGPVWKEEDFSIEIIKEGFIFAKMPDYPNSFTSIKLTQLRIQFLEEKTNKPLSDILVSISGGSNFRSNNITNETGLLKFIGLMPGSYFIRPILQEYKFNSSSFSFQINEGEEKELILEAKRIAYSAFGKVSTIGSRQFKFPIRVEAISVGCENHQEEDLIDQRSGDFRIKGLKPQCNYQISLKNSEGGDSIPAFPSFFNFIVGTENKNDINFSILPSDRPSPIVIGEIEIEQTKNSNGFRVVLLEDNNAINEQLIKSHSSLFVFNLPNYKRVFFLINFFKLFKGIFNYC
ncbi:unnamed protein product [Meloidogyne enterolobii]|uniref:Uncharacterized protein n=2 Tax=Meloidogyne enterolobii TaxID=390850 RepID=A0ACB0YTD9_MELEN